MLKPVLASMVLSMLLTPLIVMNANRIVMKLSSSDWLMQSVALTSIAKKAIKKEAHVIICGYGRSGQNLARLLGGEGIPYMALDLDPDRVRQAAAAGQSVVFGDAAKVQSLMAAGLARASAVVVSYHDTPSALKILDLVRSHAPQVPVIVRTLDDSDLDRLQQAGATEVVPEAIEGSLMMASHVLALVGVPMRRVIRLVQDQRDARYGLLRDYFHGADDDSVDEPELKRLQSVTLGADAACAGVLAYDVPDLAVAVVPAWVLLFEPIALFDTDTCVRIPPDRWTPEVDTQVCGVVVPLEFVEEMLVPVPRALKAEVAEKRKLVENRVGRERSDYICDVQKNMVIFPNLVLNDNAGMINHRTGHSPTEDSVQKAMEWLERYLR